MRSYLLLLFIIVSGCSSQKLMVGQKGIDDDLKPIVDFMEYQPGMTFADIGAGSGEITISMATLMTNSSIYIQDIDTTVLNNPKVEKFLEGYSNRFHTDLKSKNNFHIVIGGVDHTNLPDATFDLIYTNGTSHNFTAFDEIMTDIRKKLKPNGMFYLRDSFKNHNGEKEFCGDSSCGRKLLDIDEFLAAMKKNGFVMVKRNENMSGYPVFGFSVAPL